MAEKSGLSQQEERASLLTDYDRLKQPGQGKPRLKPPPQKFNFNPSCLFVVPSVLSYIADPQERNNLFRTLSRPKAPAILTIGGRPAIVISWTQHRAYPGHILQVNLGPCPESEAQATHAFLNLRVAWYRSTEVKKFKLIQIQIWWLAIFIII